MKNIITGTFRKSPRPLSERLEGDPIKQDFQLEINTGRITKINVGVSNEVMKCLSQACNDREAARNPDGMLINGIRVHLSNY